MSARTPEVTEAGTSGRRTIFFKCQAVRSAGFVSCQIKGVLLYVLSSGVRHLRGN